MKCPPLPPPVATIFAAYLLIADQTVLAEDSVSAPVQTARFGNSIPSTLSDTQQSLPLEAILGTGSAAFAPIRDVGLINIAQACGIYSNRISFLTPSDYYDLKKKAPLLTQAAEKDVLLCHATGMRPMFLLNYYDHGNEKVTFYDWKAIGKVLADHFKPNSRWLLSQGIKDWGVTTYSVFNEPENRNGPTALIPIPDYVAAVTDFANGVHSSEPRLHVIPGGFFTPCAYRDYTCAGYALALAPLFNNGTLDGIDLHDYNGTYCPINKPECTGQGMFDLVKKKCGITRDIDYYCTEFNATVIGGEKTVNSSEPENAVVFLTAMWTHLTVTGNGGISLGNLKTMSAMPYAPTGLLSQHGWGLGTQLDPWLPTARGQILQWTAALGRGMHFTDVQKGCYQLEGNGRKLWVLQNRTGFTNNPKPVASIALSGIPGDATDIEVWYADGLAKTVPIPPASTSITIDPLRPEETVMFLARPKFLGLFSRKTHGAAGPSDLPLNADTACGITTEPRSNQKGLTLVFKFADPIASANLEVASGNAQLAGPLIFADHSVIASFAPPADKQVLKVRLSHIKTAAGLTVPDLSGAIGLLFGDVDGNGVVNSMDADLATYNISPSAFGPQRVRSDINLAGRVDQADVSSIQASLGDKISLP